MKEMELGRSEIFWDFIESIQPKRLNFLAWFTVLTGPFHFPLQCLHRVYICRC